MDPMNILNVILIFISQLDCANNKKVSVKEGFLCQGEIKNPPPKLEKVTGHLVFGLENQNEKLTFLDSLFYLTQKEDSLTYSCVVIDVSEQCWSCELGDLLFYNIFEFKNDEVCTKMPGVSIDVNYQRSEKISKQFYESTVNDIICQFLIIINRYLLNNETVFRKLDDDYRALMPQNEDQNCHENVKFSARQFILDQLNFFKSHDNYKNFGQDELHTNFYEHFSRENIKILIGDTKTFSDIYSEEELRLYVQRCFDILEELSLFQQEKYLIRYILPEKGRTSMLNKKVYIFRFNFQAILTNYEDDSPKKVEIKPEDLVFYNLIGGKVSIKHKDIFIFNHENPIYSYVAVDKDVLRGVVAFKFTCKKLFDEPIYISKD